MTGIYLPPPPPRYVIGVVDAVLAVWDAMVDLTVRERTGNNDGPQVKAILAHTGNREGDYWCAATVAYAGWHALYGRWPVPRTASCDVILAWSRDAGVNSRTPRRGSLFLVMKSDTDATHVGIVTDVFKDGRFVTREGNAADPAKPSSRNGDGLYEGRVRGGVDDKTRYTFVDWEAAMVPPSTAVTTAAPIIRIAA